MKKTLHFLLIFIACSALTLLVGHQEKHPPTACKNVVICLEWGANG